MPYSKDKDIHRELGKLDDVALRKGAVVYTSISYYLQRHADKGSPFREQFDLLTDFSDAVFLTEGRLSNKYG